MSGHIVMKKLKLHRIVSDPGTGGNSCLGGKCPAIYRSEDGRFFIQGVLVRKEIKGQINIPKGEAVIEVPEILLRELKAKI